MNTLQCTTGSPRLLAIRSAIKVMMALNERDLRLSSKLQPLQWSRDCDLGIWPPILIYSGCNILQ